MTKDDDYRILHIKLKGRKSDDGKIVSQTMRRVRNTLSKNGVSRAGKRGTAPMRGGSGRGTGYKPTLQRCAVRMSFSGNKVSGQWAAHGRYIAREGAKSEQERDQGFTQDGHVNAAQALNTWQSQGDPRMFKLILSPEFGQEVDMETFTREYMSKLERDLGVPLEWVAVDHYNTNQPHVHVALRGVDKEGHELLIQPDYIKTTLRHRAQEAVTEQLGIRTEQQQHLAFDREVGQNRYTTLDKMLQKKALDTPNGTFVDFNNALPKNETAKKMRLFQIRRLVSLEKMGLADRVGHMQWTLTNDMEKTLKKMQETGDILKTMYSARDIQSDPRMPLEKTNVMPVGDSISGRLIATGYEENTGKPYILLESTRGIVHHLYQTKAMEKARGEGRLKRGDFMTIESKMIDKDGKQIKAIFLKNHGNGHKLLTDKKHLTSQILREITKRNTLPESRSMIGWLGQYQEAIKNQTAELLRTGVIRPLVSGNGYEFSATRRTQQQKPEKKGGISR